MKATRAVELLKLSNSQVRTIKASLEQSRLILIYYLINWRSSIETLTALIASSSYPFFIFISLIISYLNGLFPLPEHIYPPVHSSYKVRIASQLYSSIPHLILQ